MGREDGLGRTSENSVKAKFSAPHQPGPESLSYRLSDLAPAAVLAEGAFGEVR